MSQRLAPRRTTGNSAQALRIWALLFLLIGVAGRVIVENRILGTASMTVGQLNTALSTSGEAMVKATVAIVMKVVSSCAVPLFAFLLVEGFIHTSSFRYYFLRVVGLALVTEVIYDFTIFGKPFYWGEQNPVFGLMIAMIMLYLFRSYGKNNLKNIMIKVLVTIVAMLWTGMLRVCDGMPIVLITLSFWCTRKNHTTQILVSAVVTCLCIVLPDGTSGTTLGSLRYLAAPMACLFIHRYNGEPDESNKLIRYAAYPAMLAAAWAVGMILF